MKWNMAALKLWLMRWGGDDDDATRSNRLICETVRSVLEMMVSWDHRRVLMRTDLNEWWGCDPMAISVATETIGIVMRPRQIQFDSSIHDNSARDQPRRIHTKWCPIESECDHEGIQFERLFEWTIPFERLCVRVCEQMKRQPQRQQTVSGGVKERVDGHVRERMGRNETRRRSDTTTKTKAVGKEKTRKRNERSGRAEAEMKPHGPAGNFRRRFLGFRV